MATLAPAFVQALSVKYRTLRALRLQTHAVAPRVELAALAARFPGALRELDRLPMAAIEARLRALDAVIADEAEAESWMQLQSAYHGFMRAVLRIRSLLASYPTLGDDPMSVLAACGYTPLFDEPPLGRFDRDALQMIVRPPGGRLNPWVIAQVARDHGVAESAVHDALFGA